MKYFDFYNNDDHQESIKIIMSRVYDLLCEEKFDVVDEMCVEIRENGNVHHLMAMLTMSNPFREELNERESLIDVAKIKIIEEEGVSEDRAELILKGYRKDGVSPPKVFFKRKS